MLYYNINNVIIQGGVEIFNMQIIFYLDQPLIKGFFFFFLLGGTNKITKI